MRNLLDKNYVIPPSKFTQQMLDDLNVFFYSRENNLFTLDPLGKLLISEPSSLFDKIQRFMPLPHSINTYLDLPALQNIFLSALKINIHVDVQRNSHNYEDFLRSKMEAPASIDMDSSSIIFRQDSILKAVYNRMLLFISVNFNNRFYYHNDTRDELQNLFLCLHLYLLDHELGHFFFSPSQEQKEKIKTTFILKNPKYSTLDDSTLHRMLNFCEDMYIEDRFKSVIYPNDPKIHQVYDLGRFFFGRSGYAK